MSSKVNTTSTIDRVRQYIASGRKYSHLFDANTLACNMSIDDAIAADFIVSADAKTTTVAKMEAKGAKSLVPNAVGHMFGRDFGCNGTATEKCESVCYVDGTLRYPDVAGVLLFNFALILLLANETLWEYLVEKYVRMLCVSRDAQRRRGVTSPLFRFHWSGDVLNEWHARAIAEACRRVDGIDCWIYTRSVFSLSFLVGVPSLRVLFSADSENAHVVPLVRDCYVDVQVAWLDDDAERVYVKRAMRCPAVRMGNVVPMGKKSNVSLRDREGNVIEAMQGACAMCKACINLAVKPDIIFTIH